MCPASRSSVCTRWVRLLKALASSMTRIGLPSLHDLGAKLIPGDPSGWGPHDRAEWPPPFLGHDREGTHYPRSRRAFTIGQGAREGQPRHDHWPPSGCLRSLDYEPGTSQLRGSGRHVDGETASDQDG